MTAAITAAGEGKSVVILESQPMVGGNSVRATGGMNAGKTVYQDDDALALSGSGDGSSHACAACTDDDDICVNGGVLGGSVLLHSGLVAVSYTHLR